MNEQLETKIQERFRSLLGSEASPKDYNAAKTLIREEFSEQLKARNGWTSYMRICKDFKPVKNHKPDRLSKKEKQMIMSVNPNSVVEITPLKTVDTPHPAGASYLKDAINFADLIRHMVKETGCLPNNKWMKTLALYFGFDESLFSYHLNQLRKGLTVKSSQMACYVITDPVEAKIADLQAQIDALKAQRNTR